MSSSKALAPLLPSSRGHYLSPKHLPARDDPRQVVSDPRARYYEVEVSERTLIPADDAQLGETHVVDWLRQTTGLGATSGWSGGTPSLSVFQETSVNGRQPHLRLGGTYEPEHVGITSW
jgi:hypothetical protein